MTIFEDLRASHEVQRSLSRKMTHGRSSADNRRSAFLALAKELEAAGSAVVPVLGDLADPAQARRRAMVAGWRLKLAAGVGAHAFPPAEPHPQDVLDGGGKSASGQ